jgi:hypothetical protein
MLKILYLFLAVIKNVHCVIKGLFVLLSLQKRVCSMQSFHGLYNENWWDCPNYGNIDSNQKAVKYIKLHILLRAHNPSWSRRSVSDSYPIPTVASQRGTLSYYIYKRINNANVMANCTQNHANSSSEFMARILRKLRSQGALGQKF